MSRITTLVSLAALIFPAALAGFSATSSSNVVVYWGQNSAGGTHTQQRLLHFCAKSEIDIIPISFLVSLKDPVLDLANAGAQCSFIPGSKLMHCPQISEDIRDCQSKYGKTILLSLGGATYKEKGFDNSEQAKAAARNIWNMFGDATTGSTSIRPFGASVIDGFDLDFEDTAINMPVFANELRRLMDLSPHRPGIEKYILTAAPQCVYPDAANYEMLNGVVSFDAIFVQFYNNNCGLDKFEIGGKKQYAFNFEIWDLWAQRLSKNKDVKVLLGVPATWNAASSGYVELDTLRQAIAYSSKYKSFGGLMAWDASQLENNPGFLWTVSNLLEAVSTSNRESKPQSKTEPNMSSASSVSSVFVAKPHPTTLIEVYTKAKTATEATSIAEPRPVMFIEVASKAIETDGAAVITDSYPITDTEVASESLEVAEATPIAEPEKELNKSQQLSESEMKAPKPPNIIDAVVTKVNIPKPVKAQGVAPRR